METGDGSPTGGVHNEFHGVAGFVVMARDISGSITHSPTFVTTSADPLDTATRELARIVGAQWRAEAGIRGLLDVSPLAIRWTADWGEYSEHHELVGSHVDGDYGDLGSFADAFLRLPHRRLVVLGGPGSGKSTLAVLLLLTLLQQFSQHDPVPVLFSLASWDPASEHLNTWLADRLIKDYPRLDQPGLGHRIAARLIEARRVIPILDGLDELPPQRRSLALHRLNQALAGDSPVILTCRTSNYRSAVRAADILRHAAVVHANPVLPHEALHYLRTAISAQRHARWQPVFTALAEDPHGPLAGALASPLMIGLLRAGYRSADRAPAHLLDLESFPDAAAIEDHLLDGLVSAAFDNGPSPPGGTRRRWNAARAERWLRRLAVDLTASGTEDLSWWQLSHRLSHRARSWRTGLIVGTSIPLLLLLLEAIDGSLQSSAFITAPVLGVLAAVVIGGLVHHNGDRSIAKGVWSQAGPLDWYAPPLLRGGIRRIRTRARLFGELQLVALVTMTALVVTIIGGILVFSIFRIVLNVVEGVLDLLGGRQFGDPWRGLESAHQMLSQVGALAGWLWFVPPVLGLLLWLSALLGRPLGNEDAATPRSGLRRGRRRAWTLSVLSGLPIVVFVLVLGLGTGDSILEAAHALLTGKVPLIAALVVAELVLMHSDWGRYESVRIWLAIRRQLPWRLTTFLGDAHRFGVLRQFGAGYQFRHTRLRERLAATKEPNSRDR